MVNENKMTTTVVILRDRGQVVIPEAIRKVLNLQRGDILQINVEKIQLRNNQ